MSDTIWVDVEGRSSDQLPGDHSIMHRLRRELDDLCAELGVVALSGFYDYSALADQHGQDTDWHSKSWFDPVPALQAIRAISDYLELHPERLDFSKEPGRKHWRPLLERELRNCESILEQAVSDGRKFSFLIVP